MKVLIASLLSWFLGRIGNLLDAACHYKPPHNHALWPACQVFYGWARRVELWAGIGIGREERIAEILSFFEDGVGEADEYKVGGTSSDD